MSTFNGQNLRTIISVSGGVAEEVNELSQGPVEVYIIDFDNLTELDSETLKDVVTNLPDDVAAWVWGQLER